jgi:uncharacterized membrane protein
MKSLFFPILALLVLSVGLVVHWRHYIPQLPERVVTHIGPSGKADQWTDKATFVRTSLLFFSFGPLVVPGIAAVSCLAIYKLPPAFVNVPHKEYWLSSREHRGEAAMIMIQFLLWFLFGVITLSYFGAIQALIMATLHPELNTNVENLSVMGLGLAFIFLQVGILLYRLYHPPIDEQNAEPLTLQ